jgi:hypothetical protein
MTMTRPNKGPRRFVATRLPVPVADALEARADRDGVTMTDALHRAVELWLAHAEAQVRAHVDAITNNPQPQG